MKRLEVLGLNEKKVENVVNELSVLLADFQVFYSNLRNFHWNIKGHGFFVLHSSMRNFTTMQQRRLMK